MKKLKKKLIETTAAREAGIRGANMRVSSKRLRKIIRESLLTEIIRKLANGKYRVYSKKKNPKTGERRNLGTFDSKKAAEDREKQVQYFKHKG